MLLIDVASEMSPIDHVVSRMMSILLYTLSATEFCTYISDTGFFAYPVRRTGTWARGSIRRYDETSSLRRFGIALGPPRLSR